MSDTHREILSLSELSEITVVPRDYIIQIVEHGIVEPLGGDPESWRFDTHMLITTRKAIRLYHDLEIDWAGIAFALTLIDELEELREEKQRLAMRLRRFEQTPKD